MPVSCCQDPRQVLQSDRPDHLQGLSPFIAKARQMNVRSNCCQLLLARVRYKKSSAPSLAGKSVIASRAQAATSSIFSARGLQ